jgi:hypothetical protein
MSNKMDSSTRQRDNLEWCRTCLAEEHEFPPPDASASGDDVGVPIDTRFANDWASPFGLIYLFGVLRGINKFRGYSKEDLAIKGNQITLKDRYENFWCLSFDFDQEGNIANVGMRIELTEGFKIRDVRHEDFDTVEQMDDAIAIPIGDGRCHIKPCGTLRQAIELRGNRLKVVEDDGGIVAVAGAVAVPTMIAGVRYSLTFSNHYRVHERARGRGLLGALGASVENPFRNISEGTISVVHGSNTHAVDIRTFPWKAGGCRAVLDCSKIAGEPAGRPATEADSEDICGMINNAHRGQEWFIPYTPNDLRERLSRSPPAYNWQSFRITNRAAVGAWLSGEKRRYVFDDREWTEVRGVVLDYGFADGGLGDLELLLRSLAVDALISGITHLTLFTAKQAPAYPTLQRLSENIEPYFVSCTIPEPGDAESRGVYIDQVLA